MNASPNAPHPPRDATTDDLVAAIERDDAETVSAILGATPRRVNQFMSQPTEAGEQMWMPLHFAARAGADAVVALLLERGVSPECRTRFAVPTQARATPLHLAAQHGHAAVTQRLLDAGADADVLDARLDRPLHLAARHGYPALISLLLDAGADLDPRNGNDRTPLHEAIRSDGGVADDHANAAALALLDAGADGDAICAKEPDARTPIERCAALGNRRAPVFAALRP